MGLGPMVIEKIRDAFSGDRAWYSRHARSEMEEEEFGSISEAEVAEAISTGEVIEVYDDDAPYPSVLVSGRTADFRPIHVVCAWDEAGNRTVVVTVYHPDPARWDDYRRRRVT